MSDVFSFELCTHPPALFEMPKLMRVANKAALAKEMRSPGNPGSDHVIEGPRHYVIDGGLLLHWLPWADNITYQQIFEQYVHFVQKKFQPATVVFDGYDGSPSTKDNAHLRRTKGIEGPEVVIDESAKFHGKKATFPSNERNKQNFIHALSRKMTGVGISTVHASGDADLLIVQTAVQRSMSETTILVGEDTDLLVLLVNHANNQSFPIFMQPKPKQHQPLVTWDIHRLQALLGNQVCENILFIHAVLGCDTTSKPYGFGKASGIKLFNKSEQFRRVATVFSKEPHEVTSEEIIIAGEQALHCLYKTNTEKTLDDARLHVFTAKVDKATVGVDPKDLPPTSNAAKYHSLRVYLQVQAWKGVIMDPLKWGWEKVGGKLFPIPKDKSHAPLDLMRVVRCACKSGCKTMACSCRKVGFECTSGCSGCKGVSCQNSIVPDLEYGTINDQLHEN